MLRVLHYRDLLLRQHITTLKPTIIIHFNDLLVGVHHQNQNPLLRFISNIPESKKQPSFTVDYLVNKCGLPPQKALSAAKNFRLCSIEKADSVISLLQSHGLTQTHITKLISQHPDLLSYDSNKNLKPKFEFLCDLGVSGPIILKLISYDSSLLGRSLQNHFIPSFNFLKSYISTKSDILMVLKRWPGILQYNLEKTLKPNISFLQVHGVPNCNISKLLINQPRTLSHSCNRFKETVEKVKKMGFDPLSPMFTEAVRVMSCISISSWDKKLMVFREFGLVENDVISAFKKQPNCMGLSEEKIRRGMIFFLEKLNLKPTDISLRPTLLMYSLEKRIVPRCAVLKILFSKGIIRRKLNLMTVMQMTEKDFLEKFVTNYLETDLELMKAYQGGTEFAGFGEVVEVKSLSTKAGIDRVAPVVIAVTNG